MILGIERLISLLCIISVSQAANEGGLAATERYYRGRFSQAIEVCKTVGTRAHKRGLDPAEVIALSYIETRHTPRLTSSAGAKGPLQALPKYWSRPQDKDYIDAGLRAWQWYRAKYPSLQSAAGRYNGAGPQSRYARLYMKHHELLQRKTQRWITR